jgi:SIT4-associating protein SAP185/190
MPILLSFLSSEHSWATQTSAGDFLKAIITISANASQNEQSCIGPNELTRQLVSRPCIEKLISDMLKGGNPLTVGVGIVIEVIRKNNSDYDPDVGAEANSVPSSRDPIYLGTLLRMFAQRVPDFMELILSPNHTIGGGGGPVTIKRKELSAAFGSKIEPLGFDRFKTCELMAELLHCSNMGLLNELGSMEFVMARDMERERLKAEGRLAVSSTTAHLSNEDLTMKSSTQTRLGSPDGTRKLEVQNASDDDGFEEVTHAADLGDDAKDDFDERPGEDDFPPTVSPLLSQIDEQFVDEPLSSPRLHTSEPSTMDDPEMAVLPLSPTKLSHEVESLGIKDEDTTMTTPPPSSEVEDTTSTPKPVVISKDVSSEKKPIVPEEQKPVEETSTAGPSESVIPATPVTLDSLARPEDTPAPLFAKKTDIEEEVPPHVPEVENEDTTMHEAGESIIMSGDHQRSIAPPVVGDFLKMQFVEHKVVPTILVSQINNGL